MRVLIVALIAAATAFGAIATIAPANAQRVKLSCVEVSPAHFVCTPAPHRP